jgi:hypothetical protein
MHTGLAYLTVLYRCFVSYVDAAMLNELHVSSERWHKEISTEDASAIINIDIK